MLLFKLLLHFGRFYPKSKNIKKNQPFDFAQEQGFLNVGQRSELSNFLKEDLDNILNQGPTTIEIH